MEVGLVFSSRFDRPAHDFEYVFYRVENGRHFFQWVDGRGDINTNSCGFDEGCGYFHQGFWTKKEVLPPALLLDKLNAQQREGGSSIVFSTLAQHATLRMHGKF